MDAAANLPPPDSSAPNGGHGAKAFLVGGGIASLAAAAFMVRDGGVPGPDITILEGLGTVGGSLDGAGSPEHGYVLRGGRMLEAKYLCTFGLFAGIPTLDAALNGGQSVTQEIEAWNRARPTSSRARLVRNGHREDAPRFGLHERHIMTIERLVLEPETLLGRTTIADQFDPAFFATDFWFMWCTTFAFQPWHGAVEFKRYLARFAHMVAGFERLEGILRTPLNQYDSLVRPLHKWLLDHGVRFELDTRVTDLSFGAQHGKLAVTGIVVEQDGIATMIEVRPGDHVLVTLGSMTDASTLGGMDAAPAMGAKAAGGAWALWERIAAGQPGFVRPPIFGRPPVFGRPEVFSGHPAQSRWVSFTATLSDPAFLHLVQDLTGNRPGEGGLVTFPDSAWLLSVVVPHQPHFPDQPEGVGVVWGYGLNMDRPGDFTNKPMPACTGREIMTEVLGHLRIEAEAANILQACICIPCMMPFITSQFMPRRRGDRPQVLPQGTRNLAFIGQFVELPLDAVFTVEYSIRSAQVAVQALLGLSHGPPPVYQNRFDPRVLLRAFRVLPLMRA